MPTNYSQEKKNGEVENVKKKLYIKSITELYNLKAQ